MGYCNTCRKIEEYCRCTPSITQNNVISDQAGRDGLDAKGILIRSGKLPSGATDSQFHEAIKGDKGDDGQQMYTNTEW